MTITRSHSGVIKKKSYKKPTPIKRSDLPSSKVKFRRMKESEKKNMIKMVNKIYYDNMAKIFAFFDEHHIEGEKKLIDDYIHPIDDKLLGMKEYISYSM